MRELNVISGFAIMLFLVTAVGHYDSWIRFFIACGAVLTAVALIVVQLPKLGNQKKKGYILRG